MSDKTMDQLMADQAAAVAELTKKLEDHSAEEKKYGEALGETEGKLEEMNDKLCDIAQMKDKLAAIETQMNRPEFKVVEDASDEAKDQLKAYSTEYWNAMRSMDPLNYAAKCEVLSNPPDEVKVLVAGDNTAGGYLLAPPEFVQQIIKPIDEFTPLRSVASVRSTSRSSIHIPKRTGIFSSTWVAESGTRAETTGLTFGLEELGTHEETAQVDVSWQDLEDSAFDLEAYCGEEFGMQFAVGEGTAFTTGDGVGKPYGFSTQLQAESKSENLGAAATIESFDGLITLQHAIKTGYAVNSNWGMRRATIGILRKVKDGSGQYLWEVSQQAADPMNFLGDRIVEMPDMPAVAANAYSVVYGDFKRGYQIVDRIGIQIIRDPFTSKSSGAVEFLARKRVGGQILLSECMRLGKISA